MTKIDFDKIWIGFLMGLVCPFLSLTIYYQINFSYMTMNEFMRYVKLADTFTALISLSVLVNLAVFYPFIWKEKYYGARGVLGATFLWSALVVFLKFIA